MIPKKMKSLIPKASKSTTDSDKPKKVLNRVMIDAKKDDFYEHPYTVVERMSLNFFEPKDNSNKFYIAELHSSDAGKGYRFYGNHGRVGTNGAAKAEPFNDLESALKKYGSKTREKLRKGYVKVDLASVSRGSDEGQKKINAEGLKGVLDTTTLAKGKSNLHPKIAEFIKHIYDEANQAVSLSLTGSVKSDIKAPLGNLGINGINAGRKLLSDISTAIKIGNTGFVRDASIQYFRYIPRKMPSDVREESTWILNTNARVEKELDILDLYEDSLRLMPVMGLSDLDSKYMGLQCDVAHVSEPETLAYLNHKISSTHASNHNYKLKVVNAYEVNMKNAPPFNDSCGNVVKLFHGSRSANLVGILSSYLKLPHNVGSDVVKTGAMFGPGIYFASDCTKSANYAFGSWAGRPNKYPTAFLMICEVALGNIHKVSSGQNFRQPPNGYHSVMGQKGANLYNNEFVVYRPDQVRLKYIIEVSKH
jgi:poly [ADP-ribose] polymerase